MKVKVIYTPNKYGDYYISPDELEKSYKTLIGKPVKLNFKEEIGVVLDVEYLKNNSLEVTMELLDLRGQYMSYGIDEGKKPYDITFMCLYMETEEDDDK